MSVRTFPEEINWMQGSLSHELGVQIESKEQKANQVPTVAPFLCLQYAEK